MKPLDAALSYAYLGWRVAPIPPGYKHPAGKELANWPIAANTDPTRIRRWWSKHPDHGVCIVTGAESGIFAVDIDPDKGGDDSLTALEAVHGPLPETVESLTGGGGRHLLYRWPQGGDIRNNQSGRLGVGIDIRGTGGQIVAPPTIHPNGRAYCWEIAHDPTDEYPVADAPDWLLDLLQADPVDLQPRRQPRPRLADNPLPGDWWQANTDWPTELARYGWQPHSTHNDATGGYYELWTRPGKHPDEGASASLYYKGSQVLKVFSTDAAPLRPDETYTLWGFHVAHEHAGDFEAAARVVGATMRATTVPQAVIPQANSVEPCPKCGSVNTKEADMTRRKCLNCDHHWTPEPPPEPPTKPSIVHNGRQLGDVTRDAVDAIKQHNDPPTTFIRAGQLVRLREDENSRPIIENLRIDHMRHVLDNAANWYRVNKDGVHTATSPPQDVAVNILATGHWPYPTLAGVVQLPVLRPDGTFHTQHGHDIATKLYHWHRNTPYVDIPDTPTASQLAEAVALIDETFCDFPWDTAADRANTWALLLTPLIRAIVGQVPMALIDAPEPGTGKGKLVHVCSIITTGHAAPLMAWPTSDEELEKKVTATLMAGNTVVVFDNVDGVIKSSVLAAVLTADTWQGRILGRTEMVDIPNRATWAATGNNIDVGGDLARRCYRIRLDSRQAQPYLRTGFKHEDLDQWVTDNRAQLLHALCTIVRSWWQAGKQQADNLPAMGGYSGWVRTIGGILNHAGVTHFLANLADFHASADREAAAWEAFIGAWHEHYGEESLSVAQLVAKMSDVALGHQLRDVLPDDLAGDFDRPQFSKRLGMALRKRCGRHYGKDGLHLVEEPRDRRRVAIYSVTNRATGLTDHNSAGPARDLARVPRAENALTRDDALQARDRGTYMTSYARENSYPQDDISSQIEKKGSRGLEGPAVPRSNHITPGQSVIEARDPDQVPRDDDLSPF